MRLLLLLFFLLPGCSTLDNRPDPIEDSVAELIAR
jgi:hypothetical protein